MKRIYVYIYQDMADFEVTVLLQRLRMTGGREIVAVSEGMEPVTAQSGLRYLPDLRIADVTPSDEDQALLIPGGPIRMEQNAIAPLVRSFLERGLLVGTICFGPQFLARAGILAERRYTTSCPPEKLADMGLTDFFPRENFIPARVVTDGNLITAQGYAFVDFAQAVCGYLHIFRDEQHAWEQLGRIKES